VRDAGFRKFYQSMALEGRGDNLLVESGVCGTDSREGRVGNGGRSSTGDSSLCGGVDRALLDSERMRDCRFKELDPMLLRTAAPCVLTSLTVAGSSSMDAEDLFEDLIGLTLRFGDGVPGAVLGGSQDTRDGRVRSGVRDDGTRLSCPE
jgi:hypothetical protein